METVRLVETVKRAQAGEQDALQDLYLDCNKNIYYYALKILRNPDDAEDATQEVFIAVQEHIAELREPAAFYGWLNQITRSRCVNYRRDNKALAGDEADEIAILSQAEDDAFLLPDKAFDDAETRRIIMDVIDNLPFEQRYCVMAYYYEQITIAQIAEDAGVSENTVKSRLALARKKIRAALDEMEKKDGIKLYGIPLALTPILRQAMREFVMPEGLATRIWEGVVEASGAAAGASASTVTAEAASSGSTGVVQHSPGDSGGEPHGDAGGGSDISGDTSASPGQSTEPHTSQAQGNATSEQPAPQPEHGGDAKILTDTPGPGEQVNSIQQPGDPLPMNQHTGNYRPWQMQQAPPPPPPPLPSFVTAQSMGAAPAAQAAVASAAKAGMTLGAKIGIVVASVAAVGVLAFVGTRVVPQWFGDAGGDSALVTQSGEDNAGSGSDSERGDGNRPGVDGSSALEDTPASSTEPEPPDASSTTETERELAQGEVIIRAGKVEYRFNCVDGIPQPMGEYENGAIMAYARQELSTGGWSEWGPTPHYWAGLRCTNCGEKGHESEWGKYPDNHPWSGEWDGSPRVFYK